MAGMPELCLHLFKLSIALNFTLIEQQLSGLIPDLYPFDPEFNSWERLINPSPMLFLLQIRRWALARFSLALMRAQQ
jgi:hypothetical protein